MENAKCYTAFHVTPSPIDTSESDQWPTLLRVSLFVAR